MNINFNCSSCSKEPQGSVPIERIIEKLNELFDRNKCTTCCKIIIATEYNYDEMILFHLFI